jgi:hypothetical protein
MAEHYSLIIHPRYATCQSTQKFIPPLQFILTNTIYETKIAGTAHQTPFMLAGDFYSVDKFSLSKKVADEIKKIIPTFSYHLEDVRLRSNQFDQRISQKPNCAHVVPLEDSYNSHKLYGVGVFVPIWHVDATPCVPKYVALADALLPALCHTNSGGSLAGSTSQSVSQIFGFK